MQSFHESIYSRLTSSPTYRNWSGSPEISHRNHAACMAGPRTLYLPIDPCGVPLLSLYGWQQTANFLGGGSLWYRTDCGIVQTVLVVVGRLACTSPASCDTELNF